METTLYGIYIICIRKCQLAIPIGILHSNLYFVSFFFIFEVENLIVYYSLIFIEVLNKFNNSTFVVEALFFLFALSLILDGNS